MSSAAVPRLIETLVQCQLLEPGQVKELMDGLPPPQLQPIRLAGELLRRKLCTLFQLQMLFAGRGRELGLGQYTLLDVLGEGGMGQVYSAWHRRLHRIDTLKVIRPERVRSPIALERFLQEARAAAQITHPNIIGIHDADECNGIHFLAMDYVPGIDLARLVRQVGPLPPAFACHYLRQVALALQHAHACDIIHRDIKPANMLLNLDLDTVTVLDLGLARLPLVQGMASELSRRGLVLGTPEYMAPEQALDPHGVDGRADVYSLGCSLYFLLTGAPPFPDGSLTQKLMAHQQQEPPSLLDRYPDLPGLEEVYRRAMAKAPAERFASPAELAAALARFEDYPACPAALAADGGTATARLLHRLLQAAEPLPPPHDDATLARLLTADNRFVLPTTASPEFSLDDSHLSDDALQGSPVQEATQTTALPPTLERAAVPAAVQAVRLADTLLADPGAIPGEPIAAFDAPERPGTGFERARLLGAGVALAGGCAACLWALGRWGVADVLWPRPDSFLAILSVLVAAPMALLGYFLARPPRHLLPAATGGRGAFAGLVRCDRCGGELHARLRRRRLVFQCPCRPADPKAPLSEAALEQMVTDLLQHLVEQERFAAVAGQVLRERYAEGQAAHEQAIAGLQPHLLGLQACIHRACADHLSGAVSGTALRDRVAEWRAQQKGLLRQIAAHLQGSQNRLEEAAAIADLVGPDAPPIATWSTAEKRRLFDFVVAECCWDGSRLHLRHRRPFAPLALPTAMTPDRA